MRDRLLTWCADLATARPVAVLVAAALVTLGAVATLPGLEVDAGHSALMNEESPQVKRAHAFNERFGSPTQMVALVEGGDEPLRRALVDALTRDLPGESHDTLTCADASSANAPGCIESVIGRVDIDGMMTNALFYLPAGDVEGLAKALEDTPSLLETLGDSGHLAGLFEGMVALLEDHGEEADPEDLANPDAAQAMAAFERALGLLRSRVQQPDKSILDLVADQGKDAPAEGPDMARGIDPRGYLSSVDGGLKLAIIIPADPSDDPVVVTPFVEHVKALSAQLVTELNARCQASTDGCADGPLRISFTGMPAVIADEAVSIRDAITQTTVIATLGIALLFGIGFRSLRVLFAGLGPLLATLLWTVAFGRLAFGRLNLLTSSFVATLLGLGIDFAIHFIARYREARAEGQGEEEAVRTALMKTGPAILTGGLTTAGAFFALGVNEFAAFAQLGMMTGVGLVFAMVTSLLVLPALILTPGLEFLRPPPARRATPSGSEGSGAGLPEWMAARPRRLVVAVLAVSIFLGLQGRAIQWSYDYIALLPPELPSVKAWHSLARQTDYSATTAALTASSMEEAERMTRELLERDTVARVESVPAFMPGDQKRKQDALRSLGPALGALEVSGQPSPGGAAAAAIEEFADALEDAHFEASGAGIEGASQLKKVVVAARSLQEAVAAAPVEVIASVDREVRDLRDKALGALRRAATGPPLGPEDLLAGLPGPMARRMASEGHFALYAHPTRPVDTEEFTGRFVAQIREVDPEATGFPVDHWESLASVRKGFREASVLATVVVFLLLLFDFRRLGPTILAVVPLLTGLIWAWGGMALFSMSYNPGNIIGFPLLVGIGVAASVHILHRYRQEGPGRVASVVRHTGLAVFLSTATTMIGFGSLSLASNRAISSLGVVLLLGVGACLVTATVFLPSLLAWMDERRRETP